MHSKWAQLSEIVSVFLVAFVVITVIQPIVGDNQISMQGAVGIANMMMMLTVWLGIRVRGQSLVYFGLSIGRPSLPVIRRVLVQSVVVFLGATAAFVVGAILMANIVGIPDGPDMSMYNYLSGNPPMLIVALLQL